MSGYVRNIEVNVEHDGKKFRVVLSPLKRSDYLMLEQGRSDQVEAFSKYADLLPSYVTEHDVVDAAGAKVETEEWSSAAYFVTMCTKIMQEHAKAASPSDP